MKEDGVKGIIMIVVAVALMSYSIYLGRYEIIFLIIFFYFAIILMDKFLKKK